MPAVRGVYFRHPQTGEDGIWVETHRGLVGRARTAFPALPGGNVSTRLSRYQVTLSDTLQALCGPEMRVTITLSSISPITLDSEKSITIETV